ncbi:hypothetical protein T440DRAFT_299833 [Plenodomus tracheiphilus IPT5]|uniref:Uncharacterized protein n=1 Tax=Plenodomus tracheiphilus IPT5 TaxID=1408161 RepID=A0A6A7ANQ7_9PLEO|nr:hypothetical protein T440DRAFT_299833 [Plenodomus tracheiphilus IPT5]
MRGRKKNVRRYRGDSHCFSSTVTSSMTLFTVYAQALLNASIHSQIPFDRLLWCCAHPIFTSYCPHSRPQFMLSRRDSPQITTAKCSGQEFAIIKFDFGP